MTENQNQPKEFDVVLGGKTGTPASGVVLGGIEGVLKRLSSANIEAQIAALNEALNYGDAGLNLIVKSLQHQEIKVHETASYLLESNPEFKNNSKVRKALNIYHNSWSFFEYLDAINVDCSPLDSLVLCPDGDKLIIGSWEKLIKVWSLKSGQITQTLYKKEHWSSDYVSLTVNANSQIVAANFFPTCIRFWDIPTGQELYEIPAHATKFAISPDFRILAHNVLNGCRIMVWNLQTRQEMYTIHLTFFYRKVASLAITPDGKYLIGSVYSNYDAPENAIKIWDLETGKELYTFNGDSYFLTRCMTISPDSQYIVAGRAKTTTSGSENKIEVWNLYTGELLHTLNGHTDYIETIVISPDGRNFISGSADKTIRIWDAQTGKLLHTLVEDSGGINYIAIFSNKQKIITACQHGTVKIWGIPNTIFE